MRDLKVILVGPMGAGKSTIGRILAAQLGWPYIDNDEELRTLNSMTLADIEKLPVSDLHQLEQNYLVNIYSRPAPFIAGAAASVVDYPAGRKILENVTTIYLKIPLEKVIERAGTSGVGRQALKENGEAVLAERYNRRDPLYSQVAKYVVELGESAENDAKKVMELLQTI
jgi:shikimate kinase